MRPTANDCRARLMACAIGVWACVLGNAIVCADAASHPGKVQTGLASFYGRAFDGKKTASGERFDSDELTAAHPTYPLGTRVRVTNRENGRSVVVRITDRGPTRPNRRDGVVIDLSRAAATRLGMRKEGRAPVRLRVLEWGSDEPSTHSDKEAKAGASGE
jgi:rare lipoprotein A